VKPRPRYQPGDKIDGRYQVHQVLMGGMGEVYLCLDLEDNYPYALKTFQQRYLNDTQRLRQAFQREVAIWIALEKHPNIVRCHWMQPLDNQPFMALEWITGEEDKGTDLRSWLRHSTLSLQQALDFTIDICRGLIHAQEKQPGLVHRDLKPENILIAQGRLAKVTDFGLVEIICRADLELDAIRVAADGQQNIISLKKIAGTPSYMAPEQWRGESLDERTDIYALGCILYEMLTGECPFQVDFRPTACLERQRWLHAMQAQHENSPIPALPPSLPAAIGSLLQSCLAKACEERPSLTDLLLQLEVLYQQQFAISPRAAPAIGEFTAIDYNNRGLTYAELQQHDAALADYRQAIQLNPALAQIYYNRGNIYKTLQQYDAALSDYGQAIKLDPTLAQAYHNRGTIYENLQRYDEALADYGQAINLDSKYPDAYSNRGNTYKALQQYDAALVDFDKAIKLAPHFAEAYNNRGVTYEALREYDAALADYRQAIALNPELVTAHLNLGALLGNQGQLREALPHFEKAALLGNLQGAQYVAQIRQKLDINRSANLT